MSLAASRHLQDNGDVWALRDERACMTWRELDETLDRSINAMLAADIRPEARIAVMSGNCLEIPIAHVAAMQAGISTVPTNPKLTPAELVYIVEDADVDLVICDAGALDTVLRAREQIGRLKIVAWRAPAQEGVVAWDAWLASAGSAQPPADRKPRPHLIYTSGTTGKPKGVETPPTMFPEVDTAQALFDHYTELHYKVGDLSPSLVVSPLYHSAAMTLLRTLAGGAQMVVMSKFDPEIALQNIDRYKVERVGMVPTHFQRLLNLPADVRGRYDVSSLKMVTHTGAACARAVKEAMIAWVGPILRETYGGSESGPTNRIFCDEWFRKPGSVGKTYAPFELLILDDQDNEVGTGQEGRIFFRDTTGRGIRYYKDPEKTAAAHIAQGVFTLGDIGYQDDEGFLYITDRAADLIISGGVNIYPAEAETQLLSHPAVLDAAVIGIPNADFGEQAHGLIVPKDGVERPSFEELDAFCREALAPYKCPKSYEFIDDLGRNPIGKLDKRALRARYWNAERTIGG